MPTFYEHLEAALSSNCHRIADLCELREAVIHKFDARIAEVTDLDELLSVTTVMSETTTLIDAEIVLLSQGSRKLMAQMGTLA